MHFRNYLFFNWIYPMCQNLGDKCIPWGNFYWRLLLEGSVTESLYFDVFYCTNIDTSMSQLGNTITYIKPQVLPVQPHCGLQRDNLYSKCKCSTVYWFGSLIRQFQNKFGTKCQFSVKNLIHDLSEFIYVQNISQWYWDVDCQRLTYKQK